LFFSHVKRGMTKQERVDNGYWVAYKIAEALEERLNEQQRGGRK